MGSHDDFRFAAVDEREKRILAQLNPSDRRIFGEPPTSCLVPDVRDPFVWVEMISSLGNACDLETRHPGLLRDLDFKNHFGTNFQEMQIKVLHLVC